VQFRIEVECKYLIALVKQLNLLPNANHLQAVQDKLDCICTIDRERMVDMVFAEEEQTQHDVKAVELVIAHALQDLDEAEPLIPFIHFGLTSQDITSVALWLQISGVRKELVEQLECIIRRLYEMYHKHKATGMLARTHGQPATPTSIGKELMVFAERLVRTKNALIAIQPKTKFGGATGGFNAHACAYPEVKWPKFADRFLKEAFDMERQQFTTQIDHYDGMAEVFDAMKRINTVLVDLCRDAWHYISLNYFTLKPASETAVGSSTMPHKVNPIHFENAEGNLMVANGLLEMLSRKLPISRLQRDLTDSTVTRNIGVAAGHSYLAMKKIVQALNSINVNNAIMMQDLAGHWEVVTEGLQTVLRSEGQEDAYEKLKQFARESVEKHGTVTEGGVARFVAHVTRPVYTQHPVTGVSERRNPVSDRAESKMRNLTPTNYTPQLPHDGVVDTIVKDM
jgi:adenylosuccinate lyase